MQIAQVIGTVVSTQKNRKLEGARLLLVQPLALDDKFKGAPLLAIDSVSAGVGEKVLIVLEGRAAGEALRRQGAPVDAAIVGIIDVVDYDDGPGSGPSEPEKRSEAAGGRRAGRAARAR
ncbi:MAG: EutN/CcmL family microcompartment protein [Acidobacteria bacterium]|nr:EutN/CcmL family microcompartment protein [Acidobacteriota bacterium]